MNIVSYPRCRPRETTAHRSECICKTSINFSWNVLKIGKIITEATVVTEDYVEDAMDVVVNPTESQEQNPKVHHPMRRRRHRNLKLERKSVLLQQRSRYTACDGKPGKLEGKEPRKSPFPEKSPILAAELTNENAETKLQNSAGIVTKIYLHLVGVIKEPTSHHPR